MLRLLRRRMLEALKEVPAGADGKPEDLSRDLTWAERAYCLTVSGGVFAFDYFAVSSIHRLMFRTLGMSTPAAVCAVVGGVMGVTASLYVFYVYVIDSLRGGKGKGKGKGKGGARAGSKEE